uniref:Disease resistance N-terminal domain-containing protein n=1 Tax=Ananas comosus var. bracteatus TaxID=296719 RepID=A0A6V7QDM0_ANACO|nr:unnamed protein product [Ananas comosus var. bracteatus]
MRQHGQAVRRARVRPKEEEGEIEYFTESPYYPTDQAIESEKGTSGRTHTRASELDPPKEGSHQNPPNAVDRTRAVEGREEVLGTDGWLLSFAKEVVQSAVASVAADELVRLLPSVDHDLEVLRTTLLTTRLRVDKAELWRFKNPHFDQLLMQLKAAFYDAEDLIAEFDYVELQQTIEGGQASLLLSSSLDLVKNLISRPPDKVQRYQRRLDDAVAAVEKAIVDLNFCDEPKLSGMLRRRQTGSSVTEPEVFGRDEERERVIALLLPFGDESRTSNDENYSEGESVSTKRTKRENVSVLPIVGMGGWGKLLWLSSSITIRESKTTLR